MLLDNISEVTVGRKILLSQLVLLHLEATLENLLSLQINVTPETINRMSEYNYT